MNTGRVWLQLYRTALFELDANKVPDRAAEAALVTRLRANCFTQQTTISKKSRL